MVYDKAKWHSDGDFPKGVPYENGGTHIGLFLAWAINHGMAGTELLADAADDLDALRLRKVTGPTILFRHLDGILNDEDLNDAGNAFAAHYYQKYQPEYDAMIRKRMPTAYHATDNWATYDAAAALIEKAYNTFLRSHGGPAAR